MCSFQLWPVRDRGREYSMVQKYFGILRLNHLNRFHGEALGDRITAVSYLAPLRAKSQRQ